MVNGNSDNIDELISRHLAGETDADGESRLLLWINKSEENRRHYFALRKAFDFANRHLQIPPSENLDIDVDQEWDHFARTVGVRQTVRPMRTWLRIAASLLLLLATGAVLYFYTSNDATVFTTASDTRTVMLPDGSEVTLNRYTELSYGDDFNEKNRTVKLTGEAFFNVAPNRQKPFVIHSGNTRVHVVGTSFNVNAYDSMQVVEVIVETGIVSIESPTAARGRVDVLPGERAVVKKSDQRISIAVNEDVNFRAWSTRHIVFVDYHLTSVIRTLARVYDAEITISTDTAPSCVVTVTFDKQSLESVMKVLANTLDLTYTINGNKVEITDAGC